MTILLPIPADDEDVTCNVCDRAFCTPRMLDRHKQKKRHWGSVLFLYPVSSLVENFAF